MPPDELVARSSLDGVIVPDGSYGFFDYNFITPRLAQGAYPTGTPPGFDLVVSLSLVAQAHTIEHLHLPFYDGPTIPDEAKLHEVADAVNAALKAGKRVLVHCDAGLNRSGLIVALSLIRGGMYSYDAVKLIQAKRPYALFNKEFVAWLHTQSACPASS